MENELQKYLLPRSSWFGRIYSLVILVSVLISPQISRAEEREMSLEECIDLSLKNNLLLASRRFDPAIAARNLQRARAGYQPNFSFRADHLHDTDPRTLGGFDETRSDRYNTALVGILPSGANYTFGANRTGNDIFSSGGAPFSNHNGFVGVDVRQPLLRNLTIDTTRREIQLGELNLRISDSRLRNVLMTLVTDVEFAWFDLVAARDQLKIFQQAYELANELVHSHRKQVEVGRMAPLDEKQAQAAVATSKAALYAARNTVKRRENTLKLLITDDFSTWADIQIIPSSIMEHHFDTISRENSWEKGLTQRPEIRQSRLELDRQDVELRFAKNRRYPSLDLAASYGLTGADQNIREGETPEHAVGVVFSVPIGNTRAKADYEARQMQLEQALIAFKQLEQLIMAQIDDAVNAVETSSERVTATTAAREFAETALDAEEKKLANGKSTNFIVLRLQNDLTQARLRETLAIVDFNRALSTLSLREASTLERHGISLKEKEVPRATEKPVLRATPVTDEKRKRFPNFTLPRKINSRR